MIVPLAIRRLDHAPHHPRHATTPRKHLVAGKQGMRNGDDLGSPSDRRTAAASAAGAGAASRAKTGSPSRGKAGSLARRAESTLARTADSSLARKAESALARKAGSRSGRKAPSPSLTVRGIGMAAGG